jgi:nitrogenase subunit NifH
MEKEKTQIIRVAGECIKVNASDNVASTLKRITVEKGLTVFNIVVDGKSILDAARLPQTFAQCTTVEVIRSVVAGKQWLYSMTER